MGGKIATQPLLPSIIAKQQLQLIRANYLSAVKCELEITINVATITGKAVRNNHLTDQRSITAHCQQLGNLVIHLHAFLLISSVII